jgi:hypothetical protein
MKMDVLTCKILLDDAVCTVVIFLPQLNSQSNYKSERVGHSVCTSARDSFQGLVPKKIFWKTTKYSSGVQMLGGMCEVIELNRVFD